DLTFFIHRRTAGVAANNVRSRNVVQWSCQLQFRLRFYPAVGQLIRRLVVVLGSMSETTGDGREVGNLLAVPVVALHGSIAQSQGEGSVGRLVVAVLREPGPGDGRSVAP